ncbi:MAG: tRNA adenosine deaminase-associated protein [Propionibacteriaceae bacterium]|nr:tRNA adenosine deaminase-associated protein [Propionibacteriaceae bacterium]
MTPWDPDDVNDDIMDDDLDSQDYDEDVDDDLEDDFDDDLDFDDFDDESNDDDTDDLDDATEDDIDFLVALYREDGESTGVPLDSQYANDFEGLIDHLQRIPGDAGAFGFVSIDSDVLLAVRVRGARHVQVFVSDAYYGDTWPLIRDAIDFLGLDIDDIPEDGPVGDLGMFADQGFSEMDLEAMFIHDEPDSEDLAERIAEGMRFGKVYRSAVDQYWDSAEEY